ncbi:SDR family oxidoreductase [Psychromarinibacter sp. S121]|uniref:SDR family oxidoreductase n=1 Tax=Psychromarinibacter sp. S121 TaxID=3415127 RepID=UPI003C7BF41E
MTIRTAIVTGASRGIGAEIARVLAADGWAVAVSYAHSSDAAAAVVDEIVAAGGRAAAVQADLSDPGAARALFDAAESVLGPVGLLVNNAGTMSLSSISETEDDMLDNHIATNLAGPFRLMREAATRIVEGGRILNLSSSVVGLYQPGYAAYAATKAGIEAVTKILAKELGSRGITVNAVAPGPVATELFLDGKSEELVDRIRGMIPLGRLGEPADIARVIRFLASADGGWINGQTLRANGGVV